MNSVLAKCIACLVIFAINLTASVGTFVYIRAKFHSRGLPRRLSLGLSAASCFSIGLFLGICYLGLYHSAATKMLSIQETLSHDLWLKTYPISEALLCVGFFILWFTEWLIRSLCNLMTRKTGSPKYQYHSVDRALSLTNFGSQSSIEDPDDSVNLLSTHGALAESEMHSGLPVSSGINRKWGNTTAEGIHHTESFPKSVLLTLAMGIHGFLEALGFGLLDTLSEVLSMGVAMVLHQTLCAATLGLHFARSSNTRTKQWFAITALVFYLILLPTGTAIGLGLQHVQGSETLMSSSCEVSGSACSSLNGTNNGHSSGHLYPRVLMSILQNFAASAFLYVVFMEILPAELSSSPYSVVHCHSTGGELKQRFKNQDVVSCVCAFFGFGFVAALRLFHNHSD